MKTLSGSIIILAGAILLQPAAADGHRLDEAIPLAAPFLLLGIVILAFGLRSKSD